MPQQSNWDQGVDDLVEDLDAQSSRQNDVRPVLLAAFQRLHIAQNKRAFESSGATTKFGAWRPLAASTRKRKRGPGILRESLKLFRSHTGVGGDYIFRVGPLSADGGSRDRVAAIHQNGALSRGIHARRLDKSDEDMDALDEVVWKYILTGEGAQ